MHNQFRSIRSTVIDEISLEGLDGITCEALWTRLSDRLIVSLPLPEPLCQEVWHIVSTSKEIEIYELPVERKRFILFDRYELVDPILGTVVEPETPPPVVYENHPVHDKEKNIMGSCPTYYTRINITSEAKKISLDDALQKWGMKLVMVADQISRNKALMGSDFCPGIELSLIQYCILERVGRSRFQGEVTLGNISLQDMKIDAKSLFYHRKSLMKYKLIVKQVHYQKSGVQNNSGSLLHLPRFYVERKPKACYMTAEVVEMLREKPNYMAEYDEIKKRIGVESSTKKLFKTAEFQRFVRTDVILPYRSIYPDAKITEWKRKGNDGEKNVRVLQLIDPDVDVLEAWTNDDEQETANEDTGLLDYSTVLLDRSLLSQAYKLIESAGSSGLSQTELGRRMGQSKLCSRMICRRLHASHLVWIMLEDVGRQRVSKFVSCKFSDSNMAEAFKCERKKMLSFLTTNKKFVPALEAGSGDDVTICSENSRLDDCSVVNNDILTEELLLLNDDNSNTSTRASSPAELDDETKKDDIHVKFIETKVNSDVKGYALECTIADNIKKDTSGISYRLLRRANMIIESVRNHQVITDPTKLMKLIHEEESNEGYLVKIDKKSLFRMLMKLSKDGYLKIIQAKLESVNKKKQKTFTFICECDVTTTNSIIVSELEQAKMKMFSSSLVKVVKEPAPVQIKDNEQLKFDSESISQSMNELKEIATNTINRTITYDAKVGKKYGYQPKLVRMKIVHNLLYHLIYGDIGECLSQQEGLDFLESQGCEVTPDILSEMSPIYTKEISWKMFIPPLPKHNGWPKGWTLMCDILLRLPLSVFLKICNISYQLPNIELYLDHPIRKHYLIKHLPMDLRNDLTMARKYIFSIHEIIQKLCYIGLIQFGPQKLKEKDQVFIYLNRRALLYDTRSAEPGYHLTKEKDFPCHKHEFRCHDDVEKYWCEFWDISVHTSLGIRNTVFGQQIILEKIDYKAILLDSLKPKEPEDAVLSDIGYIPGDKRGAAGVDSSMFSHLKRNWHWTSISNPAHQSYRKENANNVRDAKLKSVYQSVSLKNLPCHKKINAATLQSGSGMSVKSKKHSGVKKANSAPVLKRSVKKNIIREVVPRRQRRRAANYDEVDKKALQMMSKLRVDWHQDEDRLLLMCKVGLMYLFPNWRSVTVSIHIVRDILHKVTHSYNKTSKACQRRILYIMKNPQTESSVRLCLEEIKWSPEISKNFGADYLKAFREMSSNHEEFSKKVDIHYVELITALRRVFGGFGVNLGPFSEKLPQTIKEFEQKYNIRTISDLQDDHKKYLEPESVQDIQRSVIQSIIHSSLCCVRDKTRWNYQLYNIYKQYPEQLLRSMLGKLRATYMVSVKKNATTSLLRTGNLPLSSAPFQLSITYENQMRSKYLLSTFHESNCMLRKLIEQFDNKEEKGVFVSVTNGGSAASFAELTLGSNINYEICVPEQVIILDPRIRDNDPTYERILKRYKDILQSAGKDSNLSQKSSEYEDSDTEEGGNDNDSNTASTKNVDPLIDENLLKKPSEAILTPQGRIALWMMMRMQGSDNDPDSKQHLHDYFVVNSSNLYISFLGRNEKLPLSKELLYNDKKHWEAFFTNLRESNHVKEHTKLEEKDILKMFEDHTEKLNEICEIVKNIIQHVKSKTFFGITNQEILSKFGAAILNNTSITVEELLNRIVKQQLVLRVGICEPRYIHKFHASPWIVQTTKVVRLDREKIHHEDVHNMGKRKRLSSTSKSSTSQIKKQRCESQSSDHDMDIVSLDDSNNQSNSIAESEPSNSSQENIVSNRLNSLEESGPFNSTENFENTEDSPENIVSHKESNESKTCTKTSICNESAEVRMGAEYIESVGEQLKICISPWIRVDGSVNKRVLDQWLSTILSYCLSQPGILLKDVQNKFSFQLPFHTRQLVEMLVQMKCLYLQKVIRTRVNLFSKVSQTNIESATGLENASDIVIMPMQDAVLKFGVFVGDRIYSSSFLTHIK